MNVLRQGLPFRLFALFFFLLSAAVLIIALGSLALHQNAMRELVANRDERAARAAATAIVEQLRQRITLLDGLAVQTAGGETPLIVDLLADQFGGGLAIWYGSQLIATNGLGASHVSFDQNTTFSPLVFDTATQQLVLYITSIRDDATVVGGIYPRQLVAETVNAIVPIGAETGVMVVDSSGTIIYEHTNYDDAFDFGDHPGVVEALRGETGSQFAETVGGEHVITYTAVEPVGWALVIEEPWEAVAGSFLDATLLAPLLLVPLLLAALLALWFGGREIVRPLQQLTRQATALGAGEFGRIDEPVGGIAEIRQLQSELQAMARRVAMAQSSLRTYAGAVTQGQEEERRRLARELHDDTVQSLIALSQRIQLAQMTPEAPPELEKLRQMTLQIINDVRRLMQALRPSYLEDLGLLPTLEILLADMEASHDLETRLTVGGEARRLPAEAELVFYRVAQEALTNVVRHAQATYVVVHVRFLAEVTTLTIQDDGNGFTPPTTQSAFAEQGHFGLLGIYERAELLGAQATVSSSPDVGTTVAIVLPVPKNRSRASLY